MLGVHLSPPHNFPISRSFFTSKNPSNLCFLPKTLTRFSKTQFPFSSFTLFAQNGSDNLPKEEEEKQRESSGLNNGGKGEGDMKKDGSPVFNFRWSDLLNPDPDNIVAVGLTGLLTWASVQVLWQLFFISFAILAAALKYSFIAALLIFILITLL